MTDALDALGDLLADLDQPGLSARQVAELAVRFQAAAPGSAGGSKGQSSQSTSKGQNAGKGAQTGKKGKGSTPGGQGKGGKGAYSQGHPFFGNQHAQVGSTGNGAPAPGTTTNQQLMNNLGVGTAAYQAAVQAVAAKKAGKGGAKGGGKGGAGAAASKAAAAAKAANTAANSAASLAARQKTASAMPPTPASDAAANAINSLPDDQKARLAATGVPPAGYHWSGGNLEPTNGTGADAVAAKVAAATATKNSAAAAASAKSAAAFAAASQTQSKLQPSAASAKLAAAINALTPANKLTTQQSKLPPAGFKWLNGSLVIARSDEELEQRDAIAEVGDGSGANLLLPKGPIPTVSAVPPHKFTGKDLMSCSTCGQPLTANVHRSKKSAQQRAEDHLPFVRADPPTVVASRAGFDADVDHVEPKLEASMKELFGKQARATISRLKGDRGKRMLKRAATPPEQPAVPSIIPVAPTAPEAASIASTANTGLDTGQVFDAAFWGDATAKALNAHFGTIAAQAAARVQRQLKIPVGTVTDHDSLAATDAVLAARAKDSAMKVTNTTKNQILQALREGVAEGEGTTQLADRVQKVFDEASRGRAVMIAQTETVGAANQAAYAYAQHLPDVVGYKQWLCVAAGTRVASAQPVEVVERRRSAGWLTLLRTQTGRVLTVTPNHPILTERGWTPAHDLDLGDQLVCSEGQARHMQSVAPDRPDGSNPDVHHAPPKVDEVFRAAALNSPSSRMVATVPDLYSHPVDCEVEVVSLDSDLTMDLQSAISEQLGDLILKLTDVELNHLVVASTVSQEGLGADIVGTEPSFGICPLHGPTTLQLGRSIGNDLSGSSPTPHGNATVLELTAERVGVHPNAERDRPQGFAGGIVLDELVEVRTEWETGRHEVYDLVTEGGWFVAEGIIVHNSHHDDKTRPTHRVADGQQVPMAEPFIVGGTPMAMPHDPLAPAGEVINCRCAVGFTNEPGLVTTPAKLKGLVPQSTLTALKKIQAEQKKKYPDLV